MATTPLEQVSTSTEHALTGIRTEAVVQCVIVCITPRQVMEVDAELNCISSGSNII